MDFMEIIFWILVLLVPVLSRVMKKRKAARGIPRPSHPQSQSQSQSVPQSQPQSQPVPTREVQQPVAVDDPTPERELTPFEEALKQIQEALTEARDVKDEDAEPTAVEPRPSPTLARSRRPLETRKLQPKRLQTRFQKAPLPSESTPQAKPVLTAESPEDSYYDDDFEADAPNWETFHETVHSHLQPSVTIEPVEPKTKQVRSKWQEAYVMSEILNPPRSREPWRNRMTR